MRHNEWSIQENQLLISHYNRSSKQELLLLFPTRSWRAIKEKASELGVFKKRAWTEEEIEKLKLHYPLSTRNQLLEVFPTKTYRSISDQAIFLGIKKEKQDRNRISDLSPLLEESHEAYYWIGYLLADGNLNSNGKLQFNICDREAIESFCSFIKYKRKIRTSSIEGKKDIYCIAPSDFVSINQLKLKFDISDKKTKNPPKSLLNLNKELLLSLIIGFIDGDGHINSANNIIFICDPSWMHILQEIKKYIESYFSNIIPIKSTLPARIANSGYSTVGISSSYFVPLQTHCIKYKLPVLNRKWHIR